MDVYIGVDPGASGGIVTLNYTEDSKKPILGIYSMPDTEEDIWDLFNRISKTRTNNINAVIEKVGGYIGTQHPGSRMFNFGVSYGGLRMAMIGNRIPFIETTPQVWQRHLRIPARGKTESKTQWKNRLKGIAQRLYPGMGITLKTADALLIARYCRLSTSGI